jgi:hypothetical protein
MFVYQTLPDSEILIIHYENEGYEIRFHAMSVRESVQFSFIQNKIPTASERATLFEWVGPLFHEQFVLNRLRDPFRYCINHENLQYSKSR